MIISDVLKIGAFDLMIMRIDTLMVSNSELSFSLPYQQ